MNLAFFGPKDAGDSSQTLQSIPQILFRFSMRCEKDYCFTPWLVKILPECYIFLQSLFSLNTEKLANEELAKIKNIVFGRCINAKARKKRNTKIKIQKAVVPGVG
jgi:hypothetical protein